MLEAVSMRVPEKLVKQYEAVTVTITVHIICACWIDELNRSPWRSSTKVSVHPELELLCSVLYIL